MISFKIYNDDRVRRYNYFPTIKDPCILENTLLRIINDLYKELGQKEEHKFNIDNPRIANMYFTYYTDSNFHIWGQLPLSYIYNDMIRHIQSRNTDKNFFMTLESIYISVDESDYMGQASKMYITNDIIGAYITENYLTSYNYFTNNASCIMVAYIPKGNDIIAYIIATGFDPILMSKWYSSCSDINDPNSMPYIRYKSLDTIVKTYEFKYDMKIGPIDFESAETRNREQIEYCAKDVNSSSIINLRKRSKYDTEVKYGNYNLDYNEMDMYDKGIQACTMLCEQDGEKFEVSRFNQEGEYKHDYRLLRKQNDLIRIDDKRSRNGK